VAPIVTEVTEEEVGNLVKKASGTGFGSAGARDRLADLAQVNVAAKEAADRLGIQLPADVFSDNPQVRAAAGLTTISRRQRGRSQHGATPSRKPWTRPTM
jgi:hypothetical protein